MTDVRQAAAQARSELRQTEAAFDAIRSGAIREWGNTNDGETIKREQLYRVVKVVEAVRMYLNQIVATGEMEEAEAIFQKALQQPE